MSFSAIFEPLAGQNEGNKMNVSENQIISEDPLNQNAEGCIHLISMEQKVFQITIRNN